MQAGSSTFPGAGGCGRGNPSWAESKCVCIIFFVNFLKVFFFPSCPQEERTHGAPGLGLCAAEV